MDLSKTLIYGSKVKLCYVDTDIFVYEIKIEYFYKDIAEELEMRFDIRNYLKDDNRLPRIGKNQKIIFMMKEELGVKIMKEFFALRAKMCIGS